MADESSRELLTRVSADRAEAHRRYNEALTALDRAIQALPDWPAPPPAYDDSKLPAVNEAWRLVPDGGPAAAGGLGGRLSAFVWQIVGPIFRQQMAFNAALVDHLNRNARAHHDAHDAIARSLPAMREGFEGLVRFESLLVQFLQRITPLLDTRERALADAIDELRHVAEVAQRAAVMARRQIEQAGVPVAPAAAEPSQAVQRFPRRPAPPGTSPIRSSTSASRIASAVRRPRSAPGSPTTCPTSRARPTCSTSGAAVASSWIS